MVAAKLREASCEKGGRAQRSCADEGSHELIINFSEVRSSTVTGHIVYVRL
jgi:hypothetical protein